MCSPNHKGHDDLTSSPPSSRLSLAVSLECPAELLATEDSVDFPVYAKKLGTAIQNGEVDLGIAICGTGIGMSITLNKMKGVYCAKVSNESEAILCKAHNDANCIAMSEELDEDLMLDIVDKFINTPFTNVSKYIRRNDMIKELEK